MKRRKSLTRTDARKIHFKNRMLQRYGIEVNRSLFNQFVRQIQNGETLYYYKQTNTKTVHYISYEGEILPIIYDKLNKNLVTVLPKNNDTVKTIVSVISTELQRDKVKNEISSL
jgi:hypothetical protein